jgi:PAS domain S-box-containing protein
MTKPFIRTALFYGILAGGFFLVDLILDRLSGCTAGPDWLHFVMVVLIGVLSFFILNRAIDTRRRAEAVLRQARDDLEIRVRERTNELNCLFSISNLAGKPNLTLEEIFQEIVDLLPLAWHYPEVACARITLDNQVFRTENCRDTMWKQSGTIMVHGRPAGVVEVGYLEEKPARAEGPFWLEERMLLDEITERLGRITERKRAEAALRTSEDKFSTVFHFSPDAIALIRQVDYTFLDINEAFTKLFGHKRSEVVGKNWQELGIAFTDDERDTLFARYRKDGKVTDYELDFNTKTSETVTVLISLASIMIQGEACLLFITHDITGRKQSELALRQAQSELEAGIQQRIALEERQRLARELHDSVSQALYGISLGTNTALTLFETDQTKVRQALNYILTQAQAGLTEMRALIFELRPESLELEGLVAALNKQSAALGARYGVEIEVSLCDEPNIPLPIKEGLYRISQEALQNAVKHAQATRLEVSLACDPDHVRLDIRDNGVGFDPQADYPGHLGLRSMRERALKLGGKLEIDSSPEQGSHIRAGFPLILT